MYNNFGGPWMLPLLPPGWLCSPGTASISTPPRTPGQSGASTAAIPHGRAGGSDLHKDGKGE